MILSNEEEVYAKQEKPRHEYLLEPGIPELDPTMGSHISTDISSDREHDDVDHVIVS